MLHLCFISLQYLPPTCPGVIDVSHIHQEDSGDLHVRAYPKPSQPEPVPPSKLSKTSAQVSEQFRAFKCTTGKTVHTEGTTVTSIESGMKVFCMRLGAWTTVSSIIKSIRWWPVFALGIMRGYRVIVHTVGHRHHHNFCRIRLSEVTLHYMKFSSRCMGYRHHQLFSRIRILALS